MKVIDANNIDYKTLNLEIRKAAESNSEVNVINVNGQRYIGDGISGRSTITVDGIPGNDMAAFMNGTKMIVNSNGQDAIANTMNSGEVIVHGNSGDTLGYAMRGGSIYIKGNTGYRAGINMKQYEDHIPVMVIGGKTGDFLGEYMAGGIIVVLGLNLSETESSIGNYCGTGMFGGVIYVRGSFDDAHLSLDVSASRAENEDMEKLLPNINEFCNNFSMSVDEIMSQPFIKITPSTSRPYKKLYVC